MSALVPTPSVDDTSTGWLVALGVEAEQAAEPTDVADDLGPERRADLAGDAVDRFLAGGDAHAGCLVGLTHRALLAGLASMTVGARPPSRRPPALVSERLVERQRPRRRPRRRPVAVGRSSTPLVSVIGTSTG